MNALARTIISQSHFQGVFSIDNLPNFGCTIPASYIIHVNHRVCYAVIFYSKDKVVVMNPATNIVATPPELILELCYLCDVQILNLNINFLIKHMFGTCLFFIFHCIDSLDKITECFPPQNSYIEHMDNIHDFLKVKNPIRFNQW